MNSVFGYGVCIAMNSNESVLRCEAHPVRMAEVGQGVHM